MKPGFHMVPPGSYYPPSANGSQVKKMNRKVISLILMTLLVTSATGLAVAPAQALGARSRAAETLTMVLEGSDHRVTTLFEEAEADGVEVPEAAWDQLQAAKDLKDEAQALFDAGLHEECIAKAMEALNAYGKATAQLCNSRDEADGDQAEEDGIGLLVAIEHAWKHLDRLRSVASSLEAQGLDVAKANELLDQAEEALLAAEEAVETGDTESARELLGVARPLLGQATGELMRLSALKKKEMVKNFVEEMKNRVQHQEARMLAVLANVGAFKENAKTLSDEFKGVREALGNTDVDKEELGAIVDRLDHLVKEARGIGKGLGAMEDRAIQVFQGLSGLESKIERYRARLSKLEEMGYDVHELEGLLDEAEAKLSDAMARLEEGDRVQAEDLAEQIDGLLDYIDELIDEAGGQAGAEMGKVKEMLTKLFERLPLSKLPGRR